MHYYNLNFYQNGRIIVDCFMQVDADNAKKAMKICKQRLKLERYRKELKEIKEQYPSYTMKTELSIYN